MKRDYFFPYGILHWGLIHQYSLVYLILRLTSGAEDTKKLDKNNLNIIPYPLPP